MNIKDNKNKNENKLEASFAWIDVGMTTEASFSRGTGASIHTVSTKIV